MIKKLTIVLTYLCTIFILTQNSYAQIAKPGHKSFIKESIEKGLPKYDSNYNLVPQGEYSMQVNGPIKVKKFLGISPYHHYNEISIYSYEALAPFQSDDGQTGRLFCEAYVMVLDQEIIGAYPAVCDIYEWDNESLKDED